MGLCTTQSGCGGMLGSPVGGGQRPSPRAANWANPPPAHTNGSTSSGIPVGIAVARQRVQSTPPPPLTVLTCEERSHITGWPIPPPHPNPHWHYPGGVEGPAVGLQLARDPLSGQFILLPAPSPIDSMQRTVVWPGCAGGLPPPLQVMQQPQHLLLDRLVTLAAPAQDKRRTVEEPLTSVMVPCDFSKGNTGGGGGCGSGQGLALIQSLGTGGGGTHHFPASLLIHQIPTHNNSLLLTAEQSLNTSVVISSSNQLATADLGGPHQAAGVLTAGVASLEPSSLVISHTETTNHHSFVSRSNLNATASVFPPASLPPPPPAPPALPPPPPVVPSHHPSQLTPLLQQGPQAPLVILKEDLKQQELEEKQTMTNDKATSPATDIPSDITSQLSDEETKEGVTCVQDASNQTETPTASDDDTPISEIPKINAKVEVEDPLVKEKHEEKTENKSVIYPEIGNEIPIYSAVELLEEGIKKEEDIKISFVLKEEVHRPIDVIEQEIDEINKTEEEDEMFSPDLSGLELLSNSIAEYESAQAKNNTMFLREEHQELSLLENGKEESEEEYNEGGNMPRGLGLLCELAHQRFIEESLNGNDIKEEISPIGKPKEKRHKEIKTKGNGENAEWKITELKRLYNDSQKTKPTLKVGIKKGPGRPKKSPPHPVKKARLTTPSPSPSDPPILEPSWCTSPNHKSGILSPPTLTPHKRKITDSPTQDSDSSGSGKQPPPLSPACSSSKKRKVGRPKKRSEKPVQTETIVSKPLRCSKTIVDLLLATNQVKQETKPKIRPKLKAEAKIKSWCDEDELEWSPTKENGSMESLNSLINSERSWNFKPKEKLVTITPKKLKVKKKEEPERKTTLPSPPPTRKPVKVLAPKLKRESIEKPSLAVENIIPIETESTSSNVPECTLTIKHLESLPCRVLVAMGGLFYAGQLTEVTPPDLYGVTLDKERGHRPHILCREQILTDAILEIRCDNLLLSTGTRLCAYWSQQYRCLYPGTVCSNSLPDDKFVNVEFDDGDNGKINRDDIRLLPHNYPIVEYDPNPLLSLGKRKRHNSTNSCDSQVKFIETHEPVSHIELDCEEAKTSETLQKLEIDIKPEIPIQKEEEHVETKPIENNCSLKIEEVTPTPPSPRLEEKKQILEEVPVLNKEVLNPVLKPEIMLPEKEEPVLENEVVENVTEKIENTENPKEPKLQEAASTAILSYDSEQERKRLKKKKKEKLKQKLLEIGNFRRHRHKHKEGCSKESCKAKHKHKHKHRHRRHKHKHCKPLGPVIENSSNTESTEPPEEDDQPPVIEPIEPIKEDQTGKKGVGNRKSRQGSAESKSKMAPFLPARQLWGWSGKGFKRGKGQGRRKTFYRAIQRGKETISVGDCAVFLSTGRPDRPYIGRIESMWECWGSNMLVRVSWFYHPEETIGCPDNLPYPGALFESPHNDENDVQTISHKCEVLPLSSYKEKLTKCPTFLDTVYDNNDTYYLAGYYDPTNITLKLEAGIGNGK